MAMMGAHEMEGVELMEQPVREGVRLNKLLQTETYWICKFDALMGLNEEINFRPFWLLILSSLCLCIDELVYCFFFIIFYNITTVNM